MATRGGRQWIPRPPGARPGAPAPWADLPPPARRFTLDAVRRACADLPPPRPAPFRVPGSRGAAVLVPLYEQGGEARVLLTKRPDSMPSHRGEIAFPGGGRHDDDPDLLATALREAEEEVGIRPETVEVVGELDTLATVASRFTITPFVGLLAEPPELHPDPSEVAAVYAFAVSELLDPAAFREERWDIPEGLGGPAQPDRPVHFYELPGETVWGATARVLTELLTHLVVPRLPGGSQGRH